MRALVWMAHSGMPRPLAHVAFLVGEAGRVALRADDDLPGRKDRDVTADHAIQNKALPVTQSRVGPCDEPGRVVAEGGAEGVALAVGGREEVEHAGSGADPDDLHGRGAGREED